MPIASEYRLRLYNAALRRIGARRLSSAAENREPRRVLDDAWGDDDAVVKYILERGDWNFSLRGIEVAPTPSVTPGFGYKHAYSKPDDLIALHTLSANSKLDNPLVHGQYRDEAGYWWTDYEPLYVVYVSSSMDYGRNTDNWTQSFRELVEIKLAYEVADRIGDSLNQKNLLYRDLRDGMAAAKSADAMQDGVKFPTPGNWVRSRTQGQRNGRGRY